MHFPKPGKHFTTLLLVAALAACNADDSSKDPSAGTPTKPGDTVTVTNKNRLITFDRVNPTVAKTEVSILGLAHGEFITGIDLNPNDNLFYCVTNKGTVAVLDIVTGVAEPLEALQPKLGAAINKLPDNLIGIDISPVTGLIKAIGGDGKNYLIDLSGELFWEQTDGLVAGLTGAAFSDSFAGGVTTKLFGIDGSAGKIFFDINPTTGASKKIIDLDIPNLGGNSGFDLDAASQLAYSLLKVDNVWKLTQFDLGNSNNPFKVLHGLPFLNTDEVPTSLALIQPLVKVFGLTDKNQIVSFLPNAPEKILSTLTLKGLSVGEKLMGIDVRPGEDCIYGLTDLGRVVKIDIITGMVSSITSIASNLQSGTLSGGNLLIDWDPVKDVLRIIGGNGENIEVGHDGTINVLSGIKGAVGGVVTGIVGGVVNGLLGLVSGIIGGVTGGVSDGTAGSLGAVNIVPNLLGAAFTNNFTGALTGNLLNLDVLNGNLLNLNNLDLLNLGEIDVANGSNLGGFDILGGFNGLPLAVLNNPNNLVYNLVGVNLQTGDINLLGSVGNTNSQSAGLPVIKDITLLLDKNTLLAKK